MDPGALICRTSARELWRWRAVHILVGAPLVLVGVLSVWVGIGGGLAAPEEPSSTVMVLLSYAIVGAVIVAFGLRYALLGLRGRGVVLYEHIVEADFPGRWFLWPQRRREFLMRVSVEGAPGAFSAYAIAATGHAFALPRDYVVRADIGRLARLGLRPAAQEGKDGKEAGKAGRKDEGDESDVLVELEGTPAGAPAPPSGRGQHIAPAPRKSPAAPSPPTMRAPAPRTAPMRPLTPSSARLPSSPPTPRSPTPPLPPRPNSPSPPSEPPTSLSPPPEMSPSDGDLLVELPEAPSPPAAGTTPVTTPPGPKPARPAGFEWEEVVPP